jgi:hypothetical protein
MALINSLIGVLPDVAREDRQPAGLPWIDARDAMDWHRVLRWRPGRTAQDQVEFGPTLSERTA